MILSTQLEALAHLRAAYPSAVTIIPLPCDAANLTLDTFPFTIDHRIVEVSKATGIIHEQEEVGMSSEFYPEEL